MLSETHQERTGKPEIEPFVDPECAARPLLAFSDGGSCKWRVQARFQPIQSALARGEPGDFG
jgi:hypothetical protein